MSITRCLTFPKLFVIVLLSGYANNIILCNQLVSRFEYKFSFKPPYLAQKDGSVPFWEYGGNAIASEDNVRVAPSLKSQKGAIWSKSQTTFEWWSVEINFRVSGRGRVGADGLAFWYTVNKGDYNGPVFGSSDKWIGLGIFFDSFDNDGKHNNPYIMGIVNDGSNTFDHANDGSNQQLSGCLRDFRNKPFSTRAKIEYYMNTLTLLFHSGNTNNANDYEICFRSENVYLPKSGYFGISAATGGLADDHDVNHFLTYSLYPPGTTFKPASLPQQKSAGEEEQTLTKEYADYQRKLDREKEDYLKQYPESKHKEDMEFENLYESDSQRELNQIFSAQSHIVDSIKFLNVKLDEVTGDQKKSLSLLSNIQSSIAVIGKISGNDGSLNVQVNTGKEKQDLDYIVNTQNDILNYIKEIRKFMEESIKNKIYQPTVQYQSLGHDQMTILHEIKDTLYKLKQDTIGSTVSSCAVSNNIILVVIILQTLLFIAYIFYKNNKKGRAKKFY